MVGTIKELRTKFTSHPWKGTCHQRVVVGWLDFIYDTWPLLGFHHHDHHCCGIIIYVMHSDTRRVTLVSVSFYCNKNTMLFTLHADKNVLCFLSSRITEPCGLSFTTTVSSSHYCMTGQHHHTPEESNEVECM